MVVGAAHTNDACDDFHFCQKKWSNGMLHTRFSKDKTRLRLALFVVAMISDFPLLWFLLWRLYLRHGRRRGTDRKENLSSWFVAEKGQASPSVDGLLLLVPKARVVSFRNL